MAETVTGLGASSMVMDHVTSNVAAAHYSFNRVIDRWLPDRVFLGQSLQDNSLGEIRNKSFELRIFEVPWMPSCETVKLPQIDLYLLAHLQGFSIQCASCYRQFSKGCYRIRDQYSFSFLETTSTRNNTHLLSLGCWTP